MLLILKEQLKCIHGGSDEKEKSADPSTTSSIKAYGGGNEKYVAGTVVVTMPVNEKTSIQVYTQANTKTGVTMVGLGAVHKFW